jgi:hypothetical protein
VPDLVSADIPSQPSSARSRWTGWRVSLACAALVLALIAAGCGQSAGAPGSSNNTNGPVTLTVVHQTGTQALTITLVIVNQTSQPITWNGGCARPYYVFLRTSNHDIVQRWPSIQTGLVCHAITIITLDPGKSQILDVVNTSDATAVNGSPIPAGTYTVSVDFTFQQYNGSGPTSVSTSMPLVW